MTDINLRILMNASKGNVASVIGDVTKALGSGGLSGALTAVGIGGAAALLGVGIASGKMAADYQSAMTQLQNTTGSSDAQMQGYTATIRSLSDTTGKAQTDLAAGMYQIISANFAGADASKILTTATQAAIIAGADQTKVTTGLVVTLNAFGQKASQVDSVSNRMFKTLSLGRGQMGDLAGALQTGGALVAHYGVSITDMDATLATLSTGGMKTFGTSMTGLTQLLNVMDGKTDLITGRIHKLGISFDENKFKAMDYQQQIAYLTEAFKGHEKQMVAVLGSKQAATALGILGTQSQLLASNLKKLSDTQELAKEKTTAWAKVQGDAAFQWQKLQTVGQNFLIDIGLKLLPLLSKVMDWLTPLVKKFGDWVLTNQDLHKWISTVGNFLQSTFFPAVQNTWNAVSNLVQWFQKTPAAAQALQGILVTIGGIIAGMKVAGLAQDIAGLGQKAMDFATNAGPKLLNILLGTGGLSDAETAVGKNAGIAASALDGEGTAAAAAGTESSVAAGEIGTTGGMTGSLLAAAPAILGLTFAASQLVSWIDSQKLPGQQMTIGTQAGILRGQTHGLAGGPFLGWGQTPAGPTPNSEQMNQYWNNPFERYLPASPACRKRGICTAHWLSSHPSRRERRSGWTGWYHDQH